MNKRPTSSILAPIAVFAIVILLFFVPSFIENSYYLRVFINTFYLIVLTVTLRLIFLTGQISLAHYAFMGIGAYTSVLLVTKLHWSFWATLPLAGIMAALVAIVLGYITLRIKGAYFAITTAALGEVIRMVWVEWKEVFGGANGIMGIPSPDSIGGWKFGSMPSFYYIGLLLMLVTVLVMYRLDKSRFGMTFRSIALADNLAESIGINIMNYKVLAFTIGCFFAGLAGAFYSSLQHYISPTDFTNLESIMLVVFLVVGGRANLFGPILGVGVLVWLPVLLQEIPNYKPTVEPLIYGGFLLFIMLFIPEGVLGIPARVRSLFKARNGPGEQTIPPGPDGGEELQPATSSQ
jgi:branched-chain amino acid transport system permease protein